MDNTIDAILNTPSGVATTVSISTINLMGVDLPFLINVGTAIYLLLLIIHKGWKMYKEWKTGKHDESEE
jgi:hypothetical protein